MADEIDDLLARVQRLRSENETLRRQQAEQELRALEEENQALRANAEPTSTRNADLSQWPAAAPPQAEGATPTRPSLSPQAPSHPPPNPSPTPLSHEQTTGDDGRLRLFDRPLVTDPVFVISLFIAALVTGVSNTRDFDLSGSNAEGQLLAYLVTASITLAVNTALYSIVAAYIRKAVRRRRGARNHDRLNAKDSQWGLLAMGAVAIALALAFAVSLALSQREAADGPSGPPGASGNRQSCISFMNGFLSMARDSTGVDDAIRRLTFARAAVTDPYIVGQMNIMIANLRNEYRSNAPGVNIINHCINNGYVSEADVESWAAEMRRLQ